MREETAVLSPPWMQGASDMQEHSNKASWPWRTHWGTCQTATDANTDTVHGNTGKTNHTLGKEYHEALQLLFERMLELSSPRATLFIRRLTQQRTCDQAIRNDDVDLVELPTCLSKCTLYNRFCLDNWFEVTFDHVGHMQSMTEAPDSDPTFEKPPSWLLKSVAVR
jgi:hypothetical protein